MFRNFNLNQVFVFYSVILSSFIYLYTWIKVCTKVFGSCHIHAQMPRLVNLTFLVLFCHEERIPCNSSRLYPFSNVFHSFVLRRPNFRHLVSYEIYSDTIVLFKSCSVEMPISCNRSLNNVLTYFQTQCKYAFKHFVYVIHIHT